MIATTRAAVFDTLRQGLPGVALLGELPDDVAEVPAIVVGRPTVSEGDATVVLDVDVDLWVIGRRISGTGADRELDELADSVLEAFGGSRGVTFLFSSGDRATLSIPSIVGRTVNIGPLAYPVYLATVEASVRTCDVPAPVVEGANP